MSFSDLNHVFVDGDVLHRREQAAMALRLGWTTVATAHHAQDRLTDNDRSGARLPSLYSRVPLLADCTLSAAARMFAVA